MTKLNEKVVRKSYQTHIIMLFHNLLQNWIKKL